MAVFLSNICKFNSCGMKFGSLPELIRHIEDQHLDIDSVENPHPTAFVPVSCVLRIFSSQNDDLSSMDQSSLGHHHHHDSHHHHHHHHQGRKSINSPAASLSTTPTEGSELDDDAGFESDSGQSSIESCWNHPDSQTMSKFHQIMGSNATSPISAMDIHSRLNGKNVAKNDTDKKFICTFNGCTKQYRTSNSLSHHRRNVHKAPGLMVNVPMKPSIKLEDGTKKYKCFCGKEYKTSHGLKSHTNMHHNNQNNQQQNAIIISQAQNQNGETMAIQAIDLQQSEQKSADSYQQQRFMQINQTPLSAIIKAENNIDNNILQWNNNKNTNNIKITTSIFNTAEIISEQSCPPVSSIVEVTSEPKNNYLKNSPSIISAPTLQQHLLSPIIPKVNTA